MADGVKLLITEPITGQVDRSALLFDGGTQTSFTLTQGQRGTASIDLILRANNTYLPQEGWPVLLQDIIGGVTTTRFAGTVDTVESKFIGDLGDRVTTLTLVSLEQCFDTITVGPRAYFGRTAGYIVNDLLTNVCSGVPVTAGTISAGVTLAAEVYEDTDVVSDVLTALATACGFVWYVDPATQTLQFVSASAMSSPNQLVDGTILFEDATASGPIDWKGTRQNYRNRQTYQMSQSGAPQSQEHIATVGGPTVNYTLSAPLDTLISASLDNGGNPGAVPLVFTGIPSPGDTVAIAALPLTAGDSPYTFVAALDNTQAWQVLIGASAAACASNLADAIAGIYPGNAGVTFSLPTRENRAVNVLYMGGATLIVELKTWGADGSTWSNATAYVIGNVVLYSGTYYIALKASTNVTPGTDATTWQATTAPLGVTITSGVIQNEFLRSLTIDHTKCGGSDSTNFPFYAMISDATFKSVANGGNVASGLGYDINFWSNSAATSPLPWEVDYYDPVNGVLFAWVLLPTLSHSVNTVIYVTYGNPGITTFRGTNPWLNANGNRGAYHFRGSAASAFGSLTSDSCSSGIGTLTNTNATATDSGFIDGAAVFNGTNASLQGPADGFATQNCTVSAWVKPSGNSGNHPVWTLAESGDSSTTLVLQTSGSDWQFQLVISGSVVGTAVSSGTVQVGVWQHVVGVINATGTLLRIYVNGTAGTDDVSSGNLTGESFIGSGFDFFTPTNPAAPWFAGNIDEMHFWVAAKTQDWVTQEYNNQSAPSTFFALGSQTGIALSFQPGAPPVTSLPLVAGTDIIVTRGSPTVTMANAPPASLWLRVTYYRLGAEFVRVENTSQVVARAAIEGGTGKYQVTTSDSSNTDWPSVLAEAQQSLGVYGVLPDTLQLYTYVPGFQAGQTCVISVTTPPIATTLINGTWLVQGVRAQYCPAQGANRTAGNGCFLYQLTLQSSVQATWIAFWQQMIAGKS